jgi:hypothetical protein
MILSLLPVRTHTTPGDFFPGRMPFSTLMFPFRPSSPSGSGNGKPVAMTGGGEDETGAAGVDEMDSRPGNFLQWAWLEWRGFPSLKAMTGSAPASPRPGWNQQRERMMR